MAGVVATVASAASVDDAIAAVDAAQVALPVWSVPGPNARRAVQMKLADAFDAKAADFVDAMTEEVGATESWARFDLMLSGSVGREASGARASGYDKFGGHAGIDSFAEMLRIAVKTEPGHHPL